MGLFSKSKTKLEEPKVENRSNESTDTGYTVPVGLSFLLNRGTVNAEAVSAFFGGCELISNSIASIPIEIKSRTDNAIIRHNLYDVLRNGQMTKFMLIKSLILDAYKYGNGLAYIKRSNNGMPVEIIYRPHGTMSIIYNSTNRQLYYLDPTIRKGKIEPINVIHIYKNTRDGINGIGLPVYAQKALGLASATDNAAKDFFDSGCNLSGVLKSTKPLTSAQKLDILTSWRAAFNGSTGGNVGVLGNDLTFEKVGSSSVESQMIESRQFNVLEVCRYLNINPVLLGVQGGTAYKSIEEAQQELVLHTLLPLLNLIEEEFNRKLLLPSENDIYIDFNEDKLVLASKKDQANYYTTLVRNGLLTPNEARLELGYNPMKGGDDLMVAFSDPNQNKITGNDDDKNNEDENE